MNEEMGLGCHISPLARDVRASADGLRVALGPQPARPAALFAAALSARYQGRLGGHRRAELVFQHHPPPVAIQPVYQRLQLKVTPRLSLTVLAQPQVSIPLSESASPSVWGERIERQVVRQPILQPAGAAARERLVYHLVTERERVEPATTPGRQMEDRRGVGQIAPSQDWSARRLDAGPPALAPPAIPPARPVPRVVRRPDIVQAAEHTRPTVPTGSRDSGQGHGQSGTDRLLGGTESLPGSRPVDVNCLTDQVIQAIDRRIIAQRERLGRV